MIIFRVIEIILVIVYGGLNIYTGYMCFKGQETNYWSNIVMVIGGSIIILAILMEFFIKVKALKLLLIGIILIQGAAISYDLKMFKEIDKRNQILRLIITIIIILLYNKSV